MIQRSTAALSVGMFLLVMGGSVQSAQEKQTLETRVQQLEFQISTDSAVVMTLLDDVKKLQAHQAQVNSYLAAQVAQAQALAKTLDESEAEGFAQGINFRSRELLLAGWREQIATQQKNVPGTETKPAAPEQGRRAAR